MFKDIVLAVTPSIICDNAVDKAIAFAGFFDARLYLTHVCDVAKGWDEMDYLEASGTMAGVRDKITAYYREKIRNVPQCEVVVRAGSPHNEILRLARQKDADLIVMGPRVEDASPARAKANGSAGRTLERVSQRARCPVMIVPQEAPPVERFHRIVAATDFSAQAACAVSYAGQLARHYRAELTVFHVLDSRGPCGEALAADLLKTRERLHRAYGELLAGIGGCAFACLAGNPPEEILRLARQNKADCIILAHHSKGTDPDEALLGSTVAKVALHSPCPTMSVNRHFDLRCALDSQTVKPMEVEAVAS